VKLNKFAVLASLALAVMFAASGCGYTRIDAGHAGIVVDNFGTKRGVQDYTVATGAVFYNPWSTQVFEYPTFVQTYAFTAAKNEGNPEDESITFTDKNAVRINADISLSYQLLPDKIPSFYVKFRNDDIKDFTFGYLHNVTRTAFDTVGGKYAVESIMGDNGQFLSDVKNSIQKEVEPFGVQIQQLGFIGYPRPPQQITDSINQAQQAKYLAQQKQNELLQSQADAAKAVAAAKGQAEANQALTAGITDKLLEWQKLQLQSQQLAVTDRWINRWNGVMPTVTAGSENPGLLLNLPVSK
jgi:regulator of protease activity HflC (stomatin/prohibitin superfamily)